MVGRVPDSISRRAEPIGTGGGGRAARGPAVAILRDQGTAFPYLSSLFGLPVCHDADGVDN